MPSTTDNDGVYLSLSVMEVVDNFGLQAKIVGITSDGGGNLWVSRGALELNYTNEYVFPPPKPILTMDCLAHILSGACKSRVQSIKSDDGEVDTELTRLNMQKCITWTKKSQKGAQDLREAQIHCGIKEKRLLAPVSTRFAYLIHSLMSLLENKPSIEYLYRTTPRIHDNIRSRRPSLVGWEVIHMIVTSTKRIVVSIVLNQCSGK